MASAKNQPSPAINVPIIPTGSRRVSASARPDVAGFRRLWEDRLGWQAAGVSSPASTWRHPGFEMTASASARAYPGRSSVERADSSRADAAPTHGTSFHAIPMQVNALAEHGQYLIDTHSIGRDGSLWRLRGLSAARITSLRMRVVTNRDSRLLSRRAEALALASV